jgi:hypothetical protein
LRLSGYRPAPAAARDRIHADPRIAGRTTPRNWRRQPGVCRTAAHQPENGNAMNSVIYIVGLIVVVIAVLSFVGLT